MWRIQKIKTVSMHYTIKQLAVMINITANELFQILLDCSHVCGQDGVYAVADSGKELGGIDCEQNEHEEYGVMFPCELLDDFSIKEGIAELRNKQKFTHLLRHAK